MLCALAFLPVADVTPTFEKMLVAFKPDERKLTDYFEATWIGKKRGRGRVAPKFPLALWNIHDRAKDAEMLTTNHAEMFHRCFSDSLCRGLIPTCLQSYAACRNSIPLQ